MRRLGSIVFMEQPEIHLHPGAQSALADVMIDVINSREGGADRNIQLIIETHSEHFLASIATSDRRGKGAAGKSIGLFRECPRKRLPLFEALRLNEFGNILNWPEHFFGNEMGDIAEQAKHALRRRKKKNLSSESAK